MDWQERYADKLTSPNEAAALVQSGQSLWVGMFNGVPTTFGKALLARHAELSGVDIYHYVSPFPWSTPETGDAFHLITAFTTPVDRQAVADGRADYIPYGNFRAHGLRDAAAAVRTS